MKKEKKEYAKFIDNKQRMVGVLKEKKGLEKEKKGEKKGLKKEKKEATKFVDNEQEMVGALEEKKGLEKEKKGEKKGLKKEKKEDAKFIENEYKRMSLLEEKKGLEREKKGEKKGLKKEKKELKNSLKEVLDLIRRNPDITYSDLMAALHITQTPLYNRIKELKEMGAIKREGGRYGGKWVVVGRFLNIM